MKQTNTKHCNKCDTTKLTTEFHKKSAAKDGLYPHCKVCKKEENSLKHYNYVDRFPSPKVSVYGIKDEDSKIVKIGKSTRTAYRMYQHFVAKNPRSTRLHDVDTSNFTYEILWEGTEDNLDYLAYQEDALISLHRPKYNAPSDIKRAIKSYEG